MEKLYIYDSYMPNTLGEFQEIFSKCKICEAEIMTVVPPRLIKERGEEYYKNVRCTKHR